MNSPNPKILTVNGGSSSIKFAVYEVGSSLQQTLKGAIEQIGTPLACFRVATLNDDDEFEQTVQALDYPAAVKVLIDWAKLRGEANMPTAIGHRVVHGGPNFNHPETITTETCSELRKLSPFAPEHLPEEILLIEAFRRQFPDVPQVVCFDTAFHQSMPRVAQLMSIPRHFEKQGVRRYGFHGLSYEFLMGELTKLDGSNAANGRVILAHLGNGASLAAVKNGAPVDTSMGFTPLSGIPMGTRSGDIDPGLVGYLARTQNMDANQFSKIVGFQSGLLGVSETSSDMRELLKRKGHDVRAKEAIALFCYQVKKWIGSFAAALGGLDTLIFAGGIGENAPTVRAQICEGLGFLGIDLDGDNNAENNDLISSPGGRVKVRVIRTDEEIVIATSVCRLLKFRTEKLHPTNERSLC